MKTSYQTSFLTGLAAVVAASAILISLQQASAAGNRPTPGHSGNEKYIVVKITTDDKVEYKAIQSTTYSDEKKRADDDYKQRMKEWKDALKSDPKTPRPARPILKKYPDTFETQKGAQEFADKQKEQDSKDKDNKK